MEPKKEINPADFEIGVIIARLQVHKLHEGHIDLINMVCANHKQVIMFLGIPQVQNTERNPLSFAARKAMVQKSYPNIVILPIKDNRSNEAWSHELDEQIKVPFGSKTALLYGSRDSFIPYYSGHYKTMELVTDIYYSGTDVRKKVSREVLASEDFRAGVIYACTAQYPVAYPCVDIVAYNEKGQFLLGKKTNSPLWRFIGGHVDVADMSLEHAARREFMEETGGCEIGELTYVTSGKVPDWRYKNEKSGIITSLYIGKFMFGAINPSDDISVLGWLNPDAITTNDIVEEHRNLFTDLMIKINEHKIELK